MEPGAQGRSEPTPTTPYPRVVHGPLGDHPRQVIRRGALAVIALALLAVDLSFATAITGILAVVAMVGLLGGLVAGLLRAASRRIRRLVSSLVTADAILMAALVAMFVARSHIVTQQFEADSADLQGAARIYDLVFVVIGGLHAMSAALPERLARLALRMAQRPALLLAGSFAGMIAVATLALMLPVAVRRVADVSVLDSLFTITSAVCVTGLSVNDPGSTYTFFGELVILLSIQLGGIGIMTLAALALGFARDTALATQLRYAAMLDARTLADMRTTVSSIVIGTLAIEAIGALLLWLELRGTAVGLGGHSVVWVAVFHSVSAFCNAGFSLFTGNLEAFRDNGMVQAIIMMLVIFGGLGFPVMREMSLRARVVVARLFSSGQPRPSRLSMASRVVLVTSAVLVAVGTLITLAFEHDGALARLGWADKLLAALFHSVSTRTAGFNTVDIGVFSVTTLLWTCVLMFIGGSPGSTAGGIKTTTVATVLATLRGELRGREPRLGRRAIAPEVFRRAIAVVAISSSLLLLSLTGLTITDDHDFMALLFESVSAFATVGLSTGITADLSVGGKLVIICTMFVGRVGPLTIALAVASSEQRPATYRLAREGLPVG